jgi:spore coat protein JB
MNDKESLMLSVQQAGFALYDAMLYLDTHPECEEALKYFEETKDIYKKAAADYEAEYGPLLMYDIRGERYFNWLKMPWPWEES